LPFIPFSSTPSEHFLGFSAFSGSLQLGLFAFALGPFGFPEATAALECPSPDAQT